MKKNKKLLIALIFLVIFLGGLFLLVAKTKKNNTEKIYKVAVTVKNQKDSSDKETLKNYFMAGDVVLISDEEKEFSSTEKISYLILKMKLTEEQKGKLLKPKTNKLSKNEAQEKGLLDKGYKEKEMTKEELDQLLMEAVLLRKYKIDVGKLKNKHGFKVDELKKGQPFLDRVFGWSDLVEEKK